MSVYADFLRDGCPDLFEPGQVVLCSRDNVPVSAEFARARLRAVIAADREAANDGRWTRKFHPDREQRGMLGLAMALLCAPMSDKWLEDDRPRYRWEPRR